MIDSIKEQLISVEEFIKLNDDFLIVSHVHPDGDTISSSLAMGYILNHFGKSFEIVNQDPIPEKFNYLKMYSKIMRITDINKKYTNIITVDIADIDRAGKINGILNKDISILNIDHHFTNEGFGKVNLIMPSAASTTEVIYYLVNKMNITFDKELATYIYTGLLTDTGGFRYSNTTSNVMRIAAEMLDYDISPGYIAEITLEMMTKEFLEILKKALANIEFEGDNMIAWTILSYCDVLNSNEDTEGIVSYTRNIEGVEVGIFIKEICQNEFKVSLRGKSYIDVASIAKIFGGGGHIKAAGFSYKGSLEELKDKLLFEIKQTKGWKDLNELSRDRWDFTDK